MGQWLVSIPCWGEYHANTLIKHALPALQLALVGVNAKVIIHTDFGSNSLSAIRDLHKLTLGGHQVGVRPVITGETDHDTYGNCHRDVMNNASPGQLVALLNADIVVSPETFKACEARFAQGKKLIVTAATRCLFKQGVSPPIGEPARALLAWSLRVKHPSVAECFWGTGRSMIPWAIYFESASGVVLRGFHLHPLAFVKEAGLTFKGTSLDEHLIEGFDPADIHVVTSPDELALAELSPPDKLFKLLSHPLNEKAAFAWAQHRATKGHRWLFTHRIVLAGTDADQTDIAPCNNILEKLKWVRNDTYNSPLPKHFSLGGVNGSVIASPASLRQIHERTKANWLVELPAWGPRCIQTLRRYALPSIKAAMGHAHATFRFLVHTDDATQLAPDFEGLRVEFRPPPTGADNFHRLGNCHREVLQEAGVGEYVALLNADIVLSRECFAAATRKFYKGKKLIICAATRTLLGDVPPPIDAPARQLLDWTMAYAHPCIKELFWGVGRCREAWSLYFQTEHGIVLRGLHLHPLAVVKHEGLGFTGVNIDETLAKEFNTDEIHVVTAADELALAELSPPERLFPLDKIIDRSVIFNWATIHCNDQHRWFFSHRIVIQGTDKGSTDIEPCNDVLNKFEWQRAYEKSKIA